MFIKSVSKKKKSIGRILLPCRLDRGRRQDEGERKKNNRWLGVKATGGDGHTFLEKGMKAANKIPVMAVSSNHFSC